MLLLRNMAMQLRVPATLARLCQRQACCACPAIRASLPLYPYASCSLDPSKNDTFQLSAACNVGPGMMSCAVVQRVPGV